MKTKLISVLFLKNVLYYKEGHKRLNFNIYDPLLATLAPEDD